MYLALATGACDSPSCANIRVWTVGKAVRSVADLSDNIRLWIHHDSRLHTHIVAGWRECTTVFFFNVLFTEVVRICLQFIHVSGRIWQHCDAKLCGFWTWRHQVVQKCCGIKIVLSLMLQLCNGTNYDWWLKIAVKLIHLGFKILQKARMWHHYVRAN